MQSVRIGQRIRPKGRTAQLFRGEAGSLVPDTHLLSAASFTISTRRLDRSMQRNEVPCRSAIYLISLKNGVLNTVDEARLNEKIRVVRSL